MATDLTVSGWLTIPSAEQALLLPLLDEHIQLTRAETGCLAFNIMRSAQDPERFEIAERFRDREAFEAHRLRTAASRWGLATRHIPRHVRISEGDQ